MKKFILASAALAFAMPAVSLAQETMAEMSTEMTAEQTTMYDGWPADRRATYDAWPADYQTYYWTLTPDQQAGWWVLTDAQRTQVYSLAPEQRAAAWTSIVAQMNGAPPPAAAATTTSSTMASNSMATTTAAASGNIQYVSGERAQATPGDTGAATGDVPVCTANQQDNCINSWEKNKTGNKPLDYWPGQPASEM